MKQQLYSNNNKIPKDFQIIGKISNPQFQHIADRTLISFLVLVKRLKEAIVLEIYSPLYNLTKIYTQELQDELIRKKSKQSDIIY